MSTNDERRPTFIPEDDNPLKHSFVPPTTEYPKMPAKEIDEDNDSND